MRSPESSRGTENRGEDRRKEPEQARKGQWVKCHSAAIKHKPQPLASAPLLPCYLVTCKNQPLSSLYCLISQAFITWKRLNVICISYNPREGRKKKGKKKGTDQIQPTSFREQRALLKPLLWLLTQPGVESYPRCGCQI